MVRLRTEEEIEQLKILDSENSSKEYTDSLLNRKAPSIYPKNYELNFGKFRGGKTIESIAKLKIDLLESKYDGTVYVFVPERFKFKEERLKLMRRYGITNEIKFIDSHERTNGND
jgi:hypothetical protein